MFKRILSFFTRAKFVINPDAQNIPEGVFVPLEAWQNLYLVLFSSVENDNRLTWLATFIQSEKFKSLGLDVNNPNHSFLLGYAMCAALYEQKEIVKKAEAQKFLDTLAGVKEEEERTTH